MRNGFAFRVKTRKSGADATTAFPRRIIAASVLILCDVGLKNGLAPRAVKKYTVAIRRRE
jgi:hypothetical protein